MTEILSDIQLSQLSDLVADRIGLFFPKGRWRELERHANMAAKEFGFIELASFLKWLINSPLNQEQVEKLSSYLTISETYFWREPHVFDALRDKILPELIHGPNKNKRYLRVWSAGCATGEEPYSIAIALRQALPDWKNWHITLMATDINPVILRRAAAGVYGEWSFRNTPPDFKQRYFTPIEKNKYVIHEDIRKMVTFAYLNLAADIFPSPMNHTNALDIIFCRNVLMYFAPARAQLVGQQLYNCLVENGWFIVSSSELSQQIYPQFKTISYPNAILYRRDSSTTPPGRISAREELPSSVRPPKPTPLQVAVSRPAIKSRPPSQSQQVEAQSLPTPSPVKAFPNNTVESSLLVRELANQGKLAEAWAECETRIASDKLDPGLLYLGANILQELNRMSEAIQLLKRALYLDPNFILAHFTLGNLALRNGNLQEARKSFENVLDILKNYAAEDILPEADGMTVGRLNEFINATLQTGALTL